MCCSSCRWRWRGSSSPISQFRRVGGANVSPRRSTQSQRNADPAQAQPRLASRVPRPPRLDLEALKLAALAVGLLALMVGVAMFLIQNDLTVAVRVALALGIILLGAYVAMDPEDVWRRLSGRGAIYSGN